MSDHYISIAFRTTYTTQCSHDSLYLGPWQSVAACFLATVVPGIILVIICSIINWFMCRKLPIKVSPPISGGEQVKEFGRASYKGFFALLMPIIVLSSIYGGVFTPTESAGLAALYCIFIGFFIYCTLNFKS